MSAPTDPAPRITESIRIYAKLREAITGLEIAPGAPLDERDLSSRFGVSRSPVREALLRLSADGLIVALDGDLVVTQTTLKDQEDFLLLRGALSTVVCRLAAVARSSRDVTALGAANARLAVTEPQWSAAIPALREFRLTVAAASGNSIFAAWTHQLLDQEERFSRLRLTLPRDHPTIANSALRRSLVDAVSRGDAHAAETAALEDHNALTAALKAHL
jgi:DNA-binding GntR family transcriptional regulator